MKFKTAIIESEFEVSDGRLQHILYSLDSFCLTNFDIEITITSIYRDEDGSTHSTNPVRAGDVRVQPDGGKMVFDYGQLKLIGEFLDHYIYDESRPHLNSYRIHPNKSSTGLHLHVQVNYNEFTKII